MSSRQMEEMMEREADKNLAAQLGISFEDLQELEYDIDAHESNDGVLYGYNVTFHDGCDPEILAQIPGADKGWVRIGTF